MTQDPETVNQAIARARSGDPEAHQSLGRFRPGTDFYAWLRQTDATAGALTEEGWRLFDAAVRGCAEDRRSP